MEKKAYICVDCYNNKEEIPYVFPLEVQVKIFNGKCRHCGNDNIKELSLTQSEFSTILDISRDPDYIIAMSKLKEDNIIEFYDKLSQIKQNTQQNIDDNIPKCPTCGSTNIKKISATKRWVGTGLFGLASSDMGKTMQCNSCGYKF